VYRTLNDSVDTTDRHTDRYYNDPTGHSTYNFKDRDDDGPAPEAQRPVGPVLVPGERQLVMRARMRATTMGQLSLHLHTYRHVYYCMRVWLRTLTLAQY
jgi:hypothetical protein